MLTDTMVNTIQDNRKLTKVKVRFTLGAGMVEVGNQGLDDRYICLRSHRIPHPVVSGLRQSHSITFSRPGFQPNFTFGFGLRRSYAKKQKHKSLQYRSKVSYHLSSHFSRDESRFS